MANAPAAIAMALAAFFGARHQAEKLPLFIWA
jgi:hypothetical protein